MRGFTSAGATDGPFQVRRHLPNVMRQRRFAIPHGQQVGRRRAAPGWKQMPFRQQRAGEGDSAIATRGGQHSPQTRMQWESMQIPADGVQTALVDRTKPSQQRDGRIDDNGAQA